MKKLKITVDGKVYEVLVEILDDGGESIPRASAAPRGSAAPFSAPVTAPPVQSSAPRPTSGGVGSIPSPLAGKVVAVDVKSGQTVQAGATLITLEAMKMNTFVTAPHAGTVGSIQVKVGDPVEEGQALLTLS